ncbi:hypothetical protein [Heyndrickxia camelliae]|uniref:Uncharacterized protein n=1 Tax=Heyndrickxia camelliae TaxID=1707093 RepID=A0A2N3LNI0_9BACI|nr:hypothetical protein [Heyndrickxia camelliae]PKR86117.1 hypothetical protein CWO92_07020 [Heyndrickxia camelliae]
MEYAVYKGEEIICIGTALECAKHMGIKVKSFRFYLTPSYQRRIEKRNKPRNYITVVEIQVKRA